MLVIQFRPERVPGPVPARDQPRDGGGHRGLRGLGPGGQGDRPAGQEDTQGG